MEVFAMQHIFCSEGKCIDLKERSCEEVFEDKVKVIECELMQKLA